MCRPKYSAVLAAAPIVLLLAGLSCRVRKSVEKRAEKRKALSAQQEAFLAERSSAHTLIGAGSLDGLASTLYALYGVVIYTPVEDMGKTRMHSPFPEFYKPTWQEFFDCIARHTKTSWHYDPKRENWVFAEPSMPVPFQVTLAKGWRSEARGEYVYYGPPSAPVGMDIYMVGSYSADDPKAEDVLFDKVKKAIAVRFAKDFAWEVTPEDMMNVKIGDIEALHFRTEAPQTGIIWRQWIIVDAGMAFAIVSAIKPEHEKKLLPDVTAMLKSFKLKAEVVKQADKPKARDDL